ncbi:uncharacterized protein EKO05_0010763 [Ascochyta rabiei]|nr:uncharacterized protein EKO05_0010763 [Ascochyta rabiei]UPX20534.1 hypothetical protein EKO05_0010763 [Ascochyta rabiei]
MPAHAISVFAGNMEDSIKRGELPISTPLMGKYSLNSVRKHTTFMKTFFFEELAEKHARKISLIHIYPGLVDGPTFYSDANPLWVRIAWRVLKPLASWYMTSPEVCGQVMVFLATNRYPAKGTMTERIGASPKYVLAFSSQIELGGGSYAGGQRGDEIKSASWAKVRKQDTGKKICDHTMKVLVPESYISYFRVDHTMADSMPGFAVALRLFDEG